MYSLYYIDTHLFFYIYYSAVKQLIVINRTQNKSFYLHNMLYVCALCTFIMYINTHT